MPQRRFLHELRRRHVFRVAAAYAVVGWLLIEVATQIFPVFHMPDWAAQLVVLLVLIGFPIAVVLAWAFEITPDGVRRTVPAESPAARAPEHGRRVGRRLNFIIIAVLALVLAVLADCAVAPRAVPEDGARRDTCPIRIPDRCICTASGEVAGPHGAAIPAKSIAVLPFESLSTDKDNAYFADGIQDLILTGLAGIGDLKVISRTSTMRTAASRQHEGDRAGSWAWQTMLEGSVQKAGDRVRSTCS